MKLVSACLVGINCRYDGKNSLDKVTDKLLEEYKKGRLIPVCAEQLGGLSTPRVAQEIQGCSGEYVLDGKCKVINKNREDVTEQFIRGAYELLRIAKTLDIKEYIGVQKSPSCGCGKTYDGTFSKKLINGDGVTIALLKREGIQVITEKELLLKQNDILFWNPSAKFKY